MISARAGNFLLRAPQPGGPPTMLPRRLFAVLQEPCLSSYPQGSDSQRESRQSPAAGVGVSPEGPSGGAATGAPAAAAAAAAATYTGPPKAGLDATVGPLPVSPYDPAQQPPPYGQFGSGDALHGSYGETSGAAHTPGGPGVTEGPYGPPPFGYYSAPVTSFPGYSMGPPPFIAAPLQGMGCYPAPPPLGAPYGMGTPYGAPPSGGPPQSWMPGDPQGGVWGPARPHNVRGNGPSGEGGGPPAPQTARERQRQFLSASALTEFDSLEAKCSFGLFLKGLSEGKLAGRMGFKEWLYATNVVSDMLRREVQHETNYDLLLHQQLLLLQQILKLLQRGRSNFLPHDVALLAANAGRLHGAFCMHFLTRQTQKAQEVLNAPSKELRKALQQAATEPAAAAAAAAAAGAGGVGGVEQLTEGPLTLSVYRGVCDAIVSEIVFSCARKLHSFPPSTQPSHVRALPTLMRAASAQLLPRDTSSSNNQQQYTAKRVKAVWTELLQRICPLLGRYDVLQLLQVLQGVAALSNRKIIRDNDLLTLTQAAGSLLEQDRFVSEVLESQRCRVLQELFKWSLETPVPFGFVKHIAWRAVRLFKLNLRWLSSNETAKLLPLICANRLLLSEEELLFFTEVLLKRVSRVSPLYAEAQTLGAEGTAAALFAVALNGVQPQRFGGLFSHLLQEAAGLEEIPRTQSLVFARLCWALCALRAFDPAVAGDSWSPAEVTALLQRALERVETDQPASLVLLPDILKEIEISKELLPSLQVPPALQAAATDASRVLLLQDRRQSRRLHFTLRRALEKLGCEVKTSQQGPLEETGGLPEETVADAEETAADPGQTNPTKRTGHNAKAAASETAAADTTDSQVQPDLQQPHQQPPQASTTPKPAADVWICNEQLGPYNVSFYCPARKLVLEIDDRCLGPSKYVKKRHLETTFKDEGLQVLIVGEHLFQLSRVTGEQGVDMLRRAIEAPQKAETICPPRHVQLQALLKRLSRQKANPEDKAPSPAPDTAT